MLLFIQCAGLQFDLKRMFGCTPRCKLNIYGQLTRNGEMLNSGARKDSKSAG
jgi:hypothetical protein